MKLWKNSAGLTHMAARTAESVSTVTPLSLVACMRQAGFEPTTFGSGGGNGRRSLTLQRELKELTLRGQGMSEDRVQREVNAAYRRGELTSLDKPAVTYMMSRRQVLFSSPEKQGVRVGSWHPHVMISLPFVTKEQLGLVADSNVSVLQIDNPGEQRAELIVIVPQWSDGSSAASRARSKPR
jgi:hypothetical protein